MHGRRLCPEEGDGLTVGQVAVDLPWRLDPWWLAGAYERPRSASLAKASVAGPNHSISAFAENHKE